MTTENQFQTIESTDLQHVNGGAIPWKPIIKGAKAVGKFALNWGGAIYDGAKALFGGGEKPAPQPPAQQPTGH